MLNESPLTSPRTRFALWGLVLLYGVSLYLIGLGGGTRVLTRHEVLAAQPAREMLASGQWVIPTFGGIDRLVKPPTTGWTIAAAMALGGESEFVVRLPGAVAGLIMCFAIGLAGRRFVGEEVGLVTTLVALTSYFTQMQTRLAEADIFQAAAVTVAMVVFAAGTILDGRGEVVRFPGVRALFFAAVGAAFLYKAVGAVFVGLSVGVLVVVEGWVFRNWRPARFLVSPLGWVILVACVVGWPVMAMRSRPEIGETWYRELIGRSTGEMNEPDAWHTYFWSVPMLLLPWVFFLPFAISGGLRKWWASPVVRWAAAWMVPGLVLLQLAAWKHKHYVLPLIVPLTIPIAMGMVGWVKWAGRQKVGGRVVGAVIWLLLTGGGAVVSGVWPTAMGGALPVLLGAMAVGGAVVIWMEHVRRPGGQLVATFMTAWVVSVGAQVLLQPKFDGYRPSAEFGRTVGGLVPNDTRVTLVNMGEHHMAYYLRMPFGRIERAEAVPDGWSVAPRRLVTGDEGVEVVAEMAGGLRRRESEADRPVLVYRRGGSVQVGGR